MVGETLCLLRNKSFFYKMSDPKRLEHNIVRMVWDKDSRTFMFRYFVDDFAYHSYKTCYKLLIDAVHKDPANTQVDMLVSVNDEGVNVPGVINISDYKDKQTFPDYEFDESYDLKCARIHEASKEPWIHDKIFWIGVVYDHHIIRNRLMTLKGDRYEFIRGDKSNFVSHPEHCKYRYLLDVEGGPSHNASTGYSLRVKFLLHCGRLLFMVDRPLWSWAESRLEPWVHYVPVKRDLSDLDEKIQWADDNPGEVQKIIENMIKMAPLRDDAVKQVRYLIDSVFSKGR